MRDKLREFVLYEEGERIRKLLHEKAKREYKSKHTLEEYFKFMNENACSFNVNHPQSQNHPWFFCLFTVKSQHVYGDCVEECLNRAMKI